jgi:hypothetical protein
MNICDCFRRNPNGTWTCIRAVTIQGVGIGPGVTVSRGVSFGGVDIAAWLDANCR